MAMEDGRAVTASEEEEEDYESWTEQQKLEDIINCDPCRNIMPKHPESKAYFEKEIQESLQRYMCVVSPRLTPAFEKDSVNRLYQVFDCCSGFMGLGDLLYPDILANMASDNALRCARVALEGLRGCRSDPNSLHRYGFSPLHLAAENFSVDMVKLLFRYGASANVRTKGELVVEGLLPLHVAVENATMHKYIEDHWADGHPIIDLIFLLCLPEMKMFLDTTRMIAKHTDNIVDEVWNYIHQEKHVQAAILLLAAQKQLSGRFNKGSGKASLNGFDIIKTRILDALDATHHEGLHMVKGGINGRALKRLKLKKEALLTSLALVRIVHKAGQALEEYIQTHSQVPHDNIVEHVSSILKRSGIACSGEGIDTEKLECYQHHEVMSIGGEAIEADKSSSYKGKIIKRFLGKQPPKGLAIKDVRNMFFPYWKSVLSRRLKVKMLPPCQPSRKDLLSAKASTKATKSIIDRPCILNKSVRNLGSMGWPTLSSESRRMLCTVASVSRKVLTRT